ncbi:MAG: hypothetical protein WA830_13335 [Candidatus Sulfotelmatobacter sp.]
MTPTTRLRGLARPALALTGLTLVSLALFSKPRPAAYPEIPAPPLQVTVSVSVSSAGGGKLSYKWGSTDGTIVQVNAASTTWTLPDGPGIHFAYVLVSNGKGGFTERRLLLNTDTIGNPPTLPPPTVLSPPPAGVPAGNFYRSVIEWGSVSAVNHGVRMPSVPEYLENSSTLKHYPPTGTVSTNNEGAFTISKVPAITQFTTQCAADGVTYADCTSNGPVTPSMPSDVAVTDYVYGTPLTFPPVISGNLVLLDGTPCGTQNEFFNVHVEPTATLLDKSGIKLAGPVNVNELGDYSLPYNASAASVSLKCQGSSVKVAITSLNATGVTDLGQVKMPGISAPVISGMTATLGSTVVGQMAQPITGQPSDIVPLSDAFLTEKGSDTRLQACQYYKAIGATTSCSSTGGLVGPIDFDDWQQQVKIGKYATGATEYTATYINKEDLNLAREHHSISYGANNTAAYVCNHVGPATDSQANINTAIDNTVAGLDLVACVAMDYMVHTGVNGGKPFTRFYIFGPSGALLPSVNLDTRREKFVPGTCLVCHGGDKYAGHFSGTAANVGGHFLPYDTGNFEFSTKAGLTEASQEAAIYNLNQNVLLAGPTASESALIAGWYSSSHTLNKTYLPSSWSGKGATAASFYRNVIARSCRSCHEAMVPGLNFDDYTKITPGGTFYRGEDATYDVGTTVCGGRQVVRSHSMPNSLITFNRFWNSSGTAVDQPSITSQFFGTNVSPTGTCTEGLVP